MKKLICTKPHFNFMAHSFPLRQLLYTSLIVTGNVLFLAAPVTLNAATINTWTGATSIAWETNSNWNAGHVPTAAEDVVIPSAPSNKPTISMAGALAHKVTINSGATLSVTGGDLTMAGDVDLDGTWNQSGGTVSMVTHSFKGTTAGATFIMSGGTLTVKDFQMTGAGASFSISGGLLDGAGKFDGSTVGVTLTQTGGTVKCKDMDVTGTTFNQSGATSLVKLSHDFQNTPSFISTGGTFEVIGNNGGGSWKAGTYQFYNFMVDAGFICKLDQNAANTYKVRGNWTNNGTLSLLTRATTVEFNGTVAQSINGNLTKFRNLTINKTSNSVNLNVNTSVATATASTGTLTFTQGNIVTGIYEVIISAGGTVTRTSGHVVGNLRKQITPNGATVIRTYEVGTGTDYAPINVTINTVGATSTTGSTYLTGSSTSGDHPNVATSGINSARSVNRYWSLTKGGAWTLANYNATLNFVNSDKDAGANYANFIVRKYNGAVWTGPVSDVRLANSTTGVGFTTFSDFAVGELIGIETMTTLTTSETPVCEGEEVTFTATVTSGGAPVSSEGTITFKDGATVIGGPTPLDVNGQAILMTSTLSAGSHTISAEFSGTVNFAISGNDVTQEIEGEPIFTDCPEEITVGTDDGVCSADVEYTITEGSFSLSYEFSNATVGSGSGTGSGSTFSEGTTHVVIKATGNCGENTCEFDIIVEDDEAPNVTCPTPESSYNTDEDACSATLSFILTSDDNCSEVTVSWTATGASPDSGTGDLEDVVFPKGTTTVVVTVEDAAGNTGEGCQFDVVVEDHQAPTVTCPSTDEYYNTDEDVCSATLSFTIGSNDNCTGESVSWTASGATPSSGSGDLEDVVFPEGTTTVEVTVEDASGNTGTGCEFDVVVADHQAPTVTCPTPDESYNTDEDVCSATLSFTLTSDDNCPGETISWTASGATPSSGTGDLEDVVFPEGTTTVEVTVEDAAGNTGTGCEFDVVVEDHQAPTVSCPTPNESYNTDEDVCSATLSFTITSDDNCPGETISWAAEGATPSFGTGDLEDVVFPEGTTTVVVSVEDASGNTGTGCEFDVVVEDHQAPTVTCPTPDEYYNTDEDACVATLSFTITSDDNCSGEEISWTAEGATPSSGNGSLEDVVFPKGTTTVEVTVEDAAGNTGTGCQFDVVVEDHQAPTVSCPTPDESYNTDEDECSATLSFTITSDDNCSGETISWTATGATPDNGTGSLVDVVFPKGTTTVYVSVEDASGNTGTGCQFDVVVEDHQAPTVTCPTPDEYYSTDEDLCSSSLSFTLTSGDNCPGEDVSWAAEGATPSFGTGNLEDVVFPEGTTTVIVSVEDALGNTGTGCQFDVVVEDHQAPTVTCPTPDESYETDESMCSATLSFTLTSSDNCSGEEISWTAEGATPSSGTGSLVDVVFPEGTTTVEVSVEDASGNTGTSCQFDVVVNDNEDPTISCPTEKLERDPNSGNCQYVVDGSEFDPLEFDDNCAGSTIENDYNNSSTLDGATFLSGNTEVIWTVTDASGNTATCSMTVEISGEGGDLNTYVIIAEKEAKLEKNNVVHSGGVGVTDDQGKANFKDHTFVTEDGTFAEAVKIDVDHTSVVTTQIPSAAVVTLPVFQDNNLSTNMSPDVNVPDNMTQTITGSIFRNIKVGKNATAHFTNQDIYAKKFETKDNATVTFAQCTKVRTIEVKLEKNLDVNPDEFNVWFFVEEKNVDINEGSNIHASIYALHDLHAHGKKDKPTSMTGLFIADKVEGNDNVSWYAGSQCGAGCEVMPRVAPEVHVSAKTIPQLEAIDLTAYPNPFNNEINIKLNHPESETMNVRIFDMTGRIVSQSLKVNAYDVFTTGNDLRPGMFFVEVTQGGNRKVVTVIKTE